MAELAGCSSRLVAIGEDRLAPCFVGTAVIIKAKVAIGVEAKPEPCMQNRNGLLIYKECSGVQPPPGPGAPIQLPRCSRGRRRPLSFPNVERGRTGSNFVSPLLGILSVCKGGRSKARRARGGGGHGRRPRSTGPTPSTSPPLLRKAVAVGAVSARKALTVMSAAVGEDEAAWTGAAMNMTIAALEKLIKGAGGEVDQSFEVETLILSMSPESQDKLDEAIRMAKEVIGANTARWMCLEAIAQEWMSSFPDWVPERESEVGCSGHVDGVRVSPVQMTKTVRAQPAALEEAAGVIAGMDGESVDLNPMALDARAKKLAKARLNHDSALGPLLVLVVDEKIYKEVGYTRFEDYCRDRLGMTARAARQRVWLERKMCALPALRAALKRGTITLTKALLLAKDGNPSDIEDRIADAASTTCQQVERESTEKEERKNRARGVRRLWGPKDAMETVAMAITTAKRFAAEQEEDADAEEALEAMSQLFVSVWTVHLAGKSTPKRRERILSRTNGICASPTCQRPAEHLHHLKLRSQGGDEQTTNLIGLCAICHQRRVHRGKIVVTGEAGKLLIWKLGSVDGRPVEEWVMYGDDDARKRGKRYQRNSG